MADADAKTEEPLAPQIPGVLTMPTLDMRLGEGATEPPMPVIGAEGHPPAR
jgi:hypothetical protein